MGIGMPGLRTVFQLEEKEGGGRGLSQKPHLTTSSDISLATPSYKEGCVFACVLFVHLFVKLSTLIKVL